MEEQEFIKLYNRNKNGIRKIVRRFEHNPQNQEDLVQEIFLRAWMNRITFTRDAAFRTWIHRIATNYSKNWIRDQSRRVPTEGSNVADISGDLLGTLDDDTHTSTRLLEEHDTPEDVFEGVQTACTIAGAMKEMPRGLARAMSLYIDGHNFQQIANKTGCSYELAKKRVYRARERLDEIIGGANA